MLNRNVLLIAFIPACIRVKGLKNVILCHLMSINFVLFSVPLAPITIDFDSFTSTSVRLEWNAVIGMFLTSICLLFCSNIV